MIAFAFLATVINYLDRQTLSITAPLLKQEFGMNDETYGLILSAFMLAYTVMNGLSGPFIDRFGTRVGYACCMLWWSTAGVLHMFVRGPLSLGAFRFLLGMGEAGNWPAAVKLVSEWFPAKERALASGIFNSGSALGAVIAPPLITWLVVKWGWQQAFLVVGLLGYVWLAGWWLIYRVPEHVQAELRRERIPPSRLFQTRFVPFFTLSKVFLDPVWYFYIFWIPKYLSSVHHLSLLDIGKLAWIPFVTADIGNLCGGALTTLLANRGCPIPQARKVSISVFTVLMTSAIAAVFAPNVGWSLAFVSIATFGYTGCSANMLALPADVFPKSVVASVYGFASMGSGFGGMLFSWLTGRVIDQHGYMPVLIGYGIMPLIALAILLFLCGPLHRDGKFATASLRPPAI
jgi:ACS family hexuronate transporter-like MFS transporter